MTPAVNQNDCVPAVGIGWFAVDRKDYGVACDARENDPNMIVRSGDQVVRRKDSPRVDVGILIAEQSGVDDGDPNDVPRCSVWHGGGVLPPDHLDATNTREAARNLMILTKQRRVKRHIVLLDSVPSRMKHQRIRVRFSAGDGRIAADKRNTYRVVRKAVRPRIDQNRVSARPSYIEDDAANDVVVRMVAAERRVDSGVGDI